jgi:hypothetical protein
MDIVEDISGISNTMNFAVLENACVDSFSAVVIIY